MRIMTIWMLRRTPGRPARSSHFARPLTVLVLAPTLHAGAADAGAVDLVRILTGNGHRVIVASNGGRLEDDVTTAGAEFIRLDVADFNPIFILRAAFALRASCASSAAT